MYYGALKHQRTYCLKKKHDYFCFSPDDVKAFQTASVCGGRVVPVDLLDSGDLECSLCMRLVQFTFHHMLQI